MYSYQRKEPEVMSKGVCECIYAPMGQGGLEGFVLADEYYYVKKKDIHGIYYKIYHDIEYAETCGVKYFDKYFKHVRDEIPANYKELT